MKEKVIVTGLGCLIPGIPGAEDFWKSMLCAGSFLSRIGRFDANPYRTRIAGELSLDISEHVGFNVRAHSRGVQFSLAAAQEALRHAGVLGDAARLEPCGICLGSGLGGLYFSEEAMAALHRAGPRGVSPMQVPSVDPNAIVSQVALRWGIRGPQLTTSTACSSSAHALGLSLDMLRAGRCGMVLAGGAEATISPLVFAGFDRIRAMSTRNEDATTACRPFSGDRDGFVMSEGAAMLVLETESHARARGATMLAELKGYGASGGAFNAVAPRPGGEDSLVAMRKALADAGVAPDEIDLVNPHGTGTALNDDAEELALQALLGDHVRQVYVTPTKQLTGHLLGAAAALESVHVVQSIVRRTVTPIRLHDGRGRLRILQGEARAHPIRNALNNSFGFGNNNAALVFGACR
ncbi:MAG TPA: beta-ketoacyl-[acyl-carrier-protein] synthase family protein [Burkholderiaceae bacterium]